MTQDTRKDRRVKIVSLNVRYKSATVDEFIENHAHDVSRGGIYIKTGSPFPSGTLLKFEIRLASDQAVITGVGRVVWKRDPGQGTGERPAGMGVKFIKIDDPSKVVIDRLVTTRADAGRSYEAEPETTSTGDAAANPLAPNSPPARPAPPAPNRVGKSTMLGIGQLPQTAGLPSRSPLPPRPSPSVAPRQSGGGMFPTAHAEIDASPKQEQTVMKQAAELLEEALREAGGSMEEIGTNPLFSGSSSPSGSPVAPKSAPEDDPTHAFHAVLPEVPKTPSVPPPSAGAEAARARAMVAGMSPASVAPPKRAASDPPRTGRESPIGKTPLLGEVRPPSIRPSGRPLSTPPAKKKGGSGPVILVAIAAAAAVAGVVYKDTLFGGAATGPAATASVIQTPTPPATAATDVPTPPAGQAAASASAAPVESASASASASAPAASASAPAVSAPPVRPAPRPVVVAPKPTPAAVPAAPAAVPVAPTAATAAAAATTEPVAKEPVAKEPVAKEPVAKEPSAPTTPATAPSPKPKPAAKPSDDNPY